MPAADADVIELDGTWRIRADPRDAGVAGRWWRGAVDGSWASIELPAAWQEVLGDGYDGVAWLRRTVALPEAWASARGGDRLWLRFDAVATGCRTWVNGVAVGEHVGDWVPFQHEITAAVGRATTIDLAVRVDQIAASPPSRPGGLQHGHVTKGFHDVISIAHGGIWQPVRLVRTGPVCAVPDGVSVVADASGRAVVRADLEPRGDEGAGSMAVEVLGPDGRAITSAVVPIAPAQRRAEATLRIGDVRPWSPRDPALYAARVELRDAAGRGRAHVRRFGCRTVRAQGRQILLNDEPLFLRGVLHWGHEPRHRAPAPRPEQVRDELTRLRDLGFNTVCLCMWYPPEHFFEIAAELGVLVWQEHPVWQSPMRETDLPEYRRQYQAFLRRDRRHTSVVLVSATCEHPCFHPDLASWWWRTARRELPDRLLQLQTAFFRWADPEHSDLHDEHTYDNSNRWVTYVEDLDAHLAQLPAKPFVMGETILFTSWPDLAALEPAAGGGAAWWRPRGVDAQQRLEASWRRRYGDALVERLRTQGDRFNLLSRRFQVEQLRRFPGHAGLVMSHLRDVPACQCGLMDDLDRWRFAPEDCRGWLADRCVLLWTPDHRRGFTGRGAGTPLACRAAVSNFTGRRFRGAISAHLAVAPAGAGGPVGATDPIECAPGAVESAPLPVPLPAVTAPTRLTLRLTAGETPPAAWDVWSFPELDVPWPAGVHRLDGLPFAAADGAPDEVERAYSRGYGLPARRWRVVLPNPAALAPRMPAWPADAPVPDDARVIVTHRLTHRLAGFVAAGGRVVLLASKAAGGVGAVYESLYGQVPLVIEEGPLGPGDGAWVVDMLVFDLMRRYCRVVPVEALGIAEQVDPIVRLVFTHDQPPVRLLDALFTARVGRGLLVVSSLDHGDAPGRYLLRRLVDWALRDDASARGELDPALLRRWSA